MNLPLRIERPAAALAAALIFSSAAAAASADKSAGPGDASALFPGTSSKEPITIDADKLVYYDKERKAIYSGSVVVIQGDTKMTCAAMTVLLDKSPTQGQGQAAGQGQGPAAAASAQGASATKDGQSAAAGGESGIKHLDAAGPVMVISKTQVATADSAAYDKAEDKVWLIGHVALSDGQNVTKGDKLTYDLKTGQATIDPGAKSGRVHGQFIQNSGADAAKAK